MISKSPAVFVFCALNCEARPLIDAWKLSKQADARPFHCYGGADRVVVVSGVGKIAMAGAIGHTMARYSGGGLPILLNFGIAGHPYLPCGSQVLVEKLVDSENGRCFYPKFVFDLPCQTKHLISYPRMATQYQVDALYDMEASGFYELALRFSTSELIHCLKLVSDNRDSPVDQIDSTRVSGWATDALPAIEILLQRLLQLRSAQSIFDDGQYGEIFKGLHFSATNASKLKSLLQRWQVLNDGDEGRRLLDLRDSGANNGKELLLWLERQLENSRFEL